MALDPGWTLVSLPAPALEDTLAELVDAGVDTVNRWDAAGQTYELVDVDSIGFVSDGYFVHRATLLPAVSQPLSLALDAPEAASVSVVMETGWNLVGAPAGGMSALDISPYPNTVFEWDGAEYRAASRLDPFRGYWVFNPSEPYTATATQLRHRLGPVGSAIAYRPTQPDWSIAVTLHVDDGQQRAAHVGVSDGSSIAFDGMDVAQPPPSPRRGSPGLWLAGAGAAGRLTRSIVPMRGGVVEWSVVVETPGDGSLAVDFGSAPAGYRVVLMSEGAGISDTGHVRVTSGRHEFRVRVSRDAPAVTRLLANYPNPFNPETWIPFELREPSEVSVTIYDLAGRVVRRLALGGREPGYYTRRGEAVHWNGRNTDGESVSSGAYVYEMQAGATRYMRRLVVRK